MSIKKWNNLPALILGTVMLIVVGSSIVTRFAQHIDVIDPHVIIVGDAVSDSVKRRASSASLTPPAIDGEVTRATERLRELSGVTTALVLYATMERLQGHTPGTVNDLLAGVIRQGLMPPGVIQEAQPGLLTVTHRTIAGDSVAHGNLFVRYRPQPLGIEIVAVGKEERDGPAMMMRVPNDEANDKEASYYMTTRLDDVRIPVAFAEESAVIAHGWSKETLRVVKVPQGEQQDLREWASKRVS
ncbi:MAG: hypothetical protein ACRD63_14580 [Pyrinomonadaceae bacterium]